MPLFTAEEAGALSDGATFGNTSPGVKGTDWPGETDDVDAAGYALTQGTATGVGSLTDLMTGGGTLTLTGDFTCPDVQEVEIVVPEGVTSTISFGTSGVDPGCVYSDTGFAIECQFGGTVTDVTGDLEYLGEGGMAVYNLGTWTDYSGFLNSENCGAASYGAYNDSGGEWGSFSGTLLGGGVSAVVNVGTWTDFSGTASGGALHCVDNRSGATFVNFSGTLNYDGAGYGVNNEGTFTDFSGTLNNSWTGSGVFNVGTFTDFSGTLNNSGAGYGVFNVGTFTDFSGTVNNSGSLYGVVNNTSTFTDFSGTVNNTGTGTGVDNEGGTFTNFSGTCLDSGSGVAFYNNAGTIENVTGIIGRPSSQADLLAENIVAGKSILGVVGTRYVASTTPSNAYLHRLIPSEEYRVDKRTTVFRPHTPLSGDTLNGAQSTPQSGVRISSDYPEGV